jgi:predicted enzyme related to lactoylglutathione lyase
MNNETSAAGLTVAALTVDCAEPVALAQFWGKVLHRPASPGATPENATLDATDPAGGPRMFFQKVPEPKTVKNRLHLDLLAADYDEEIERLTGLGAKRLGEVTLQEFRWTTFTDPEGNEFDLIAR